MATATFVKTSKLVDLLHLADPEKSLFVSTLDGKLMIGPDPFNPAAMIDLSREEVVPYEPTAVRAEDVEDAAARRTTRRRAEYMVEYKGHQRPAYSLKEVLAVGLSLIDEHFPGTLEELGKTKLRSRRIVARDPNKLFAKPDLVKAYAEKLKDGWYYGTNNSAAETRAWLERACLAAGIRYGVDFKTSLS